VSKTEISIRQLKISSTGGFFRNNRAKISIDLLSKSIELKDGWALFALVL
jgi:hypothetical protein